MLKRFVTSGKSLLIIWFAYSATKLNFNLLTTLASPDPEIDPKPESNDKLLPIYVVSSSRRDNLV